MSKSVRTVVKKRFSIQMATEQPPPNPAWVELRFEGGKPYRYVDQWEAEQVLDGDPARGTIGLRQRQPHVTYRIALLPD